MLNGIFFLIAIETAARMALVWYLTDFRTLGEDTEDMEYQAVFVCFSILGSRDTGELVSGDT